MLRADRVNGPTLLGLQDLQVTPPPEIPSTPSEALKAILCDLVIYYFFLLRRITKHNKTDFLSENIQNRTTLSSEQPDF